MSPVAVLHCVSLPEQEVHSVPLHQKGNLRFRTTPCINVLLDRDRSPKGCDWTNGTNCPETRFCCDHRENLHVVQRVGKQTRHANHSSKVQLQERKPKKKKKPVWTRRGFFFCLKLIENSCPADNHNSFFKTYIKSAVECLRLRGCGFEDYKNHHHHLSV